jgi:uncharacterized membrane protein
MTTPLSPSVPTPPPSPSFTRNGLGTTALVLGVIGVILAWIPFIGFFGFILGVLAIIFGAIGVYRTYHGTATNRIMSSSGSGLGSSRSC